MKYTIEWMEQKPTKDGKPKADARLKDEAGAIYEHVTIWGDFPGYAEIMSGHEIEGFIAPAKDPKYAPSLKPLDGPKRAGNANFKHVQDKEVLDIKRGDISHFQENKELSIKIASTMNKAVELAIAEFEYLSRISISTRPELDVLITKWREWLWLNWSMDESKVVPF